MTQREIEALLSSGAMKALLTEVAVNAAETATKKTAETTVNEVLTRLGIDHSDPLEMQADFRWVRDFRKTSSDVRNKSILVLLGILITGSTAAFWIGLKWQFAQYLAK